jgi:hypothetical protein
MVDGARVKDFWSQWQQTPNTTQEFQRFRNRMIETCESIWNEMRFTHYEGYRKTYAMFSGTLTHSTGYFSNNSLYESISKAKSVVEIAFAVQCLLWTFEKSIPGSLDWCCTRIGNALDLSPGIMIRLVRHGSSATLHPAGAQLLDEGVIDKNLVWLARYPEVVKPFETALKLYMSKDDSQPPDQRACAPRDCCECIADVVRNLYGFESDDQ